MAEVMEPADTGRAGIYEFRSTFADKWLLPDGSIVTSDGALVEGPDERRAEAFTRRAPFAAKFLLPDGSIVFALPGGSGGTLDHKLLNNRDAADQHPVSAITGLSEKLDANETAIETLSQAVSGTYAEIAALKTAGELIPGQRYLITDYATKYQQPVSLKIVTCAVEPLTITAESDNAFSPIAFSAAYPNDVIYYSFDDNKCEDNSTARTGFILRRHDTVRRINMPHDWRFMKWARFLVDASAMETWEEGSAVAKGTFYITGTSISKALSNGTPTSATDGSFFVEVVPDYATNYFLYNTAYGLTRLSEYVEYHTFDLNGTNDHARTTITNILIEGGADGYKALANNLWRYTASGERPWSIFAASRFENNTFNSNCREFSFGSNCRNNTFGSGCVGNTFATNCYNNLFAQGCNGNDFASSCTGNILGSNSSYNLLNVGCGSNNIGSGFMYNALGVWGGANNIGSNCSDNEFSAHTSSNTLGSNCNANAFGPYSSGNILGPRYQRIRIESKIQNKDFTNYSQLSNKSYAHTITNRADGKAVISWLDATNTPQYITVD